MRLFKLVLDSVKLVRVGHLADFGFAVVGLERLKISSGSLTKSRTKVSSLPGAGAVEARESLHGLHASEPLVHIHRVQQRLVEAGLVFLGDDQHLVFFGVEFLRQLGFAGCRRSCRLR